MPYLLRTGKKVKLWWPRGTALHADDRDYNFVTTRPALYRDNEITFIENYTQFEIYLPENKKGAARMTGPAGALEWVNETHFKDVEQRIADGITY